jgi:predicted O-methyltransferase YrrM
MNDREHYQACFDLMQAVADYRHEPIHRRLKRFGKREAMVHLDVLVLTYHLARICRGCILEIGAFRGGTTVAAAWGVRDGSKAKKLITIEPGGSLRQHGLATRNILRTLKRNLARQGVAEQVTIVEGRSFEPEVVAAVHRALDADQVGLLILDADANCKRDINRYGPKLMDGCWLIIDDYGGPADNSKVLPTKIHVDELVNSGRLLPLGYYGLGTWVGRWQGITLPRARSQDE